MIFQHQLFCRLCFFVHDIIKNVRLLLASVSINGLKSYARMNNRMMMMMMMMMMKMVVGEVMMMIIMMIMIMIMMRTMMGVD